MSRISLFTLIAFVLLVPYLESNGAIKVPGAITNGPSRELCDCIKRKRVALSDCERGELVHVYTMNSGKRDVINKCIADRQRIERGLYQKRHPYEDVIRQLTNHSNEPKSKQVCECAQSVFPKVSFRCNTKQNSLYGYWQVRHYKSTIEDCVQLQKSF